MNKYIDADRLRERIENLKIKVYGCESNTDSDVIIALASFDIVIHLIDSLQQEQESIAEKFARIVRGNLIGINKEVQQKFENLYFEVTGNKMYGGYND